MHALLDHVVASGVPGGFVECGCWKGGVAMLAAAVFKAHGADADPTDRVVWFADSFEGLPVPDLENFPADRAHTLRPPTDILNDNDAATVKAMLERVGLFDEVRTRIIKVSGTC